MARRVKNMGTATMRFNEGIIASGSIASPGHAFAPNVSMVCSGTLEFSAGTNIQKAIRIIGNDEDREISFQTTNPAAEVGKIHATPGMSLIVSGAESLDLQSGIVLINSGGAASSPDPTDSADTSFFVSGTIGSMGTAVKGTSVFGGDTFVSGNLYVADSAGMYTDKIRRFSDSDNTTKILLNDEVIKLHAGHSSNETVRVTDGKVGIGVVNAAPGHVLAVTSSDSGNFAGVVVNTNSTQGGGLKVQVQGSGANTKAFEVYKNATDLALTINGIGRVGINESSPQQQLHVIGNIGIEEGTSGTGKIIQMGVGDQDTFIDFGTDDQIHLAAGGLNLFKLVKESSAPHIIEFNGGGQDVDVHFKDSAGGDLLLLDASDKYVLINSGGAGASPNEADYVDTNFFVSGSIGSQGTSTRGTAVFGGDLVVSGNLIANSGISAAGVNGQVQYNNNGELGAVPNIYYDASNSRVGIGTAVPKFSLHSFGSTAITNNSNQAELGLYRYNASIGNGDALAEIVMGGSEDNNNFYGGATIKASAAEAWNPSAAEGTDLEIYTTPAGSTTLTQRMIITNDGKIGMGASIPQAELHVQAPNDDGDIILSRFDNNIQNDNTLGTVHFAGTENGTTWGYGARIAAIASGDWTVGSDIPTRLAFYTANDGVGSATQKMVITDDGNVGIGINPTQKKLHVTSSILIEGASATTKPTLIFQNNNGTLPANSTLGKIAFSGFNNPDNNESAIIEVQTDSASYATNMKSKMYFKTSDGSNPPIEIARIEEQTFMVGNPVNTAASGYQFVVAGNMQVTASVSNTNPTLVTDRLKAKEIWAHPDQNTPQLMMKYDDSDNAIEFNPNAGTQDFKIISENNYLALWSDSSKSKGQILIGLLGDSPRYNNYLVNDQSGLYVEGFQDTKAVATITNRSTAVTGDGLAIIIGKGQYYSTLSGDHHDEAGNDNQFIVFYDKDKGVSSSHDPDDIEQIGYIAGDGAGGITVQDSFTGTHDTVTNQVNEQGMILESTGEMWIDIGMSNATCALPKSKLCSTAKSKAVFGVVRYNELRNGRAKKVPEGWTGVVANAIGEGKVWVTNIGGNIENGDYITSSNISGYGMLQDDDILHSYTVAKCTQTVDWTTIADTIDHEGVTYKKYLIACTYHCG